MSGCELCPRRCHVNRRVKPGYCLAGSSVKAARAALHMWEEPPISGTRGSGTIFFSGCTLQCCFCQNYRLSHENYGIEITTDRLADIFLELQAQGAHNINLVSATPYTRQVIEALEQVKEKLPIPVVWNSSGYECTETLELLKGYVDIYLPDLKYFDASRSKRYSNAADYFAVASRAISVMFEQVGKPVFDSEGILQKGMILRHMVMPGGKADSVRILEWIAAHFSPDDILISLMSQYTPFYRSSEFPEINRRITSLEYDFVLNRLIALGFTNGYMQEKSSAKEEYTPPFDLSGI
jgi:putative pyruvate formate lyase activating enzyme